MHTQGEWYIDPTTLYAAPEIVTDKRRVAKVLLDGGSEDREVMDNAYLIAAAARLHRALEPFVNLAIELDRYSLPDDHELVHVGEAVLTAGHFRAASIAFKVALRIGA